MRKESKSASKLLPIIWLLLACAVITTGSASAATISIGDGKSCDFHLKGKIAHTDLVDFKRKVVASDASDPRIWWLCLNSDEGGNFDAAIQMIDHILNQGGYMKGIGTRVEPNARCFSACALVFLAGRRLLGDSDFETSRQLHPTSSLGFHQPHFREDVSVSDLSQLYRAYEAGVTAIARLLGYDTAIFPRSLMAGFLQRRSGESFNISTIDDLGRWQIGLYDYESPKLENTNQLYLFCSNADGWRSGEPSLHPMKYVREDKRMSNELRPLLNKRAGIKTGKNQFFFPNFGQTYEEGCFVRIDGPNSPVVEKLDHAEFHLNAFFGFAKPRGVEATVSTQFWGLLPPETSIRKLQRKAL